MITRSPRILAFTTVTISDPGVDLAGSAHLHYSPSVMILPLPCSSGVRPSWILHALGTGFDGVFIAADGSDCAFVPDCTTLTGKVVTRSQELIQQHGLDARRLKMAAVCSVCSESFVSHMETFARQLEELDSSRKDA